MADCPAVRKLLQRLVTGAPVSAEELAEARDHAAGCPDCRELFDLAQGTAFPRQATSGEDVPKLKMDPDDIVERALSAALADPEAITRLRAAEQLGRIEGLSRTSLEALAEVGATDGDAEVRAAASQALERQRERSTWSGAEEESVLEAEPIELEEEIEEPEAPSEDEQCPDADSLETNRDETSGD
jgi:hypothetical protein